MDDKNLEKDQSLTHSETPNEKKSDELLDEILEILPEEDRGKFFGIVRQSITASVSSYTGPLGASVTPQHITEIIKNADTQDKRDRDERKGERNYNLIILIIALVFVGFLVVFLKDQKDVLITIITAILAFAGGFGVGITRKRVKSDE